MIVDERFYAKNDNEAYEHLQQWTKDKENDVQFYYSTIHYTCVVDEHGNRSDEIDLEDHGSRRIWCEVNMPWWKKAWKEFMFNLKYYLVDKPQDFCYLVRDLIYLLKNKEAYSNQWNLDWHLLESIERNVPSLIENSISLAFLDEAIAKVHGNDPGFDLKKYHEDHCSGYPEEIEELAMEIQVEEYSNLLLYVKLYKYYANFGDIDFNDSEEVEFDKKWRHTLPIKQGTYDEFYDYDKIIELSKEYWNKIWDWMKLHGQKLND